MIGRLPKAILLSALAIIALGVGLYLGRPAALFALLPYALFICIIAVCPLGMWLVMRSTNDTKGKD
mgnify:CR=1 FL=1